MKTMLPVLFFTCFCIPAFAGNTPAGSPPIPDFAAYRTTDYDFYDQYDFDTVGCMTKTAYFQDNTFWTVGHPVSYTWDFGDGTISTAFEYQPTHTYTSPGVYTVTMTIVSNLGTTYSVTKPGYIIVGSSFSVDFGPDTIVCNANPLTLDATIPGATYLWNEGSTTPTITNTATGQYYVAVTRSGCLAKDTINITRNLLSVELGPDQDLCDGSTLTLSGGSAGADILWNTGETSPDITIWDGGLYTVDVTQDGCTAKDSVYITWKPEMSLNFGFAKVGGCLPVDMQFTDSSTACSGSIAGWSWDFGDGSSSNQQNPLHTFTSQGQFPVRLTVTAESGSTLSRTKKVTIDPVLISVDLGPDTTICFGESLILDAKNTGAGYSWSTGESSQQITVLDDGAYSVAVTQDGCVAKDTINVKTGVSAASDFGYSIGGNCLPVNVAFSDSSTSFCGQSIVGWKWTFGDGTTSTQRNPVHVYGTADSFNVKLMVTASGGSTSIRTKKVIVSNTTFNVDLPAELKICRGGSIGLDAVITGAQYSWSPSFGLSATDIRNPQLTPVTTRLYKVAVTRCSVTKSDSVLITMDSIARPVIVQDGNSLKSPDAATYQWSFEGKVITAATGKSIRVDKAGYYVLKITNANGCINQSDPYFYIPVSGNEKSTGGVRMKISPNPTNGAFNILFSDIPSKPAKVSIYDAAGKRLLVTSVQDHVNRIDIAKFMKGLYFVEIIINTDRTIIPVVRQ